MKRDSGASPPTVVEVKSAYVVRLMNIVIVLLWRREMLGARFVRLFGDVECNAKTVSVPTERLQ
jgi:hypothetical protein